MITRAQAEDLLYEEARRIDDGELDGWLELFTADAIYWVPNVVEDPPREPSIIYDDRQRMGERVFRLLRTPAYAQSPPSRTIRTVANVQVARTEHAEQATVRCTTTIMEMRVGDPGQVGLGHPRSFAASCHYVLRLEDDTWRIAQKKVRLINREQPLYNLTFIV